MIHVHHFGGDGMGVWGIKGLISLSPSLHCPCHCAGQALKDAREFGWEFSEAVTHNWASMVDAIQKHIGSLNFGYRVALRNKGVKYINALGQLQDAHTIKVRRGRRE